MLMYFKCQDISLKIIMIIFDYLIVRMCYILRINQFPNNFQIQCCTVFIDYIINFNSYIILLLIFAITLFKEELKTNQKPHAA